MAMEKKNNYYTNKTILVAGGAGSIGSALVKRLLEMNVASIRVFDRDESGVFNLMQKLNPHKIRPLVGDVCDEGRVRRAMHDVDVVFHAAALKHVSLSEYNPLDAVQVNIFGTQNIIHGALDAGVKRVINISTDKAVNPINVMGATKLVGERLIVNAHHYKGKKQKTIFCSVRFGNVLKSRGSVISILKRQIKKGGPLTVTSPDMTRFFIGISGAVDFILSCGATMKGREVFIPKMPALKIIDLANVLIEKFSCTHGINPKAIKIRIVGVRPGERMHELLIGEDEWAPIYDRNNCLVLRYPLNTILPSRQYARSTTKLISYSSKKAKLLSKEQITKLLDE